MKKQETYGQRTTAWCLWPKQKAIIKGKRENRDVGYGLEGDNDHHIMPIMSFLFHGLGKTLKGIDCFT